MFGFGKKRREQEEAEAQRATVVAAAEKRRKEMEALAANPEVAAKAAQSRAVAAAEVAEDSRRTQIMLEQQRELQRKRIAWARNNQEAVNNITDTIARQISDEFIRNATAEQQKFFHQANASEARYIIHRNLCSDVVASIFNANYKSGFTALDNAARGQQERIKLEFFRQVDERMTDATTKKAAPVNTPNPSTIVAQAIALNDAALATANAGRIDEALAQCQQIITRFGAINHSLHNHVPLRTQVARAMSNCIILLNKLNRDEEALAIADALGQRYASDSALETREKAANGLMLAGAIHTKHGDAGKTIEFCDDVFRWFGDGVASSFERICSGATTSAFLMALKAGLWREALRVIERLSLLQNKSLVGLLFAEAALLAEERDSGQLSLVEAVEAGDSLLSLVDDLADSAQSEAATVERQQLVASIEMMLARWLLDGGAWERAQALLGATQRRLENTPLDLSTSELRMLREMQAERMRFGAPEELTEVYVFRLDNGRRTPHVDELLKRKGSHLDDLLK